MIQRTTVVKKEKAINNWYHVDASEQIVGRLAVKIATVLMGKHKPEYTPHVDCGDFVVVTNCEKVVFTGDKWNKKIYRHHTGYNSGMREITAATVLEKHPDRILRMAVKRMLPKTKMGRKMLTKLKMFAGPSHNHEAQGPKDFSELKLRSV
jgi:large subunit ribosomal protein L13